MSERSGRTIEHVVSERSEELLIGPPTRQVAR